MSIKEIGKESVMTIVNLIIDLVYMILNLFRSSTNQIKRT